MTSVHQQVMWGQGTTSDWLSWMGARTPDGHIGQPAVEVLGLIAQDLQLAAGKDAFSYDELTAAMRVLFRC